MIKVRVRVMVSCFMRDSEKGCPLRVRLTVIIRITARLRDELRVTFSIKV